MSSNHTVLAFLVLVGVVSFLSHALPVVLAAFSSVLQDVIVMQFSVLHVSGIQCLYMVFSMLNYPQVEE